MKDINKIINKAKKIIIKEISPEKIILFGSVISNSFNDEHSDIDIFVVKNCNKEQIRKFRLILRKKLRELIFKYKISFDVFIDSKERIEERIKEYNDQFYKTIIDKGQIIYEK